MSAPSPYYVRVGDDWIIPFSLKNPNGTTLNLTGATALTAVLFQVRGPSWLLTGSNGSVTINTATLGTGKVFVSRELAGGIAAQPADTTSFTLGLSISWRDSADVQRTFDPIPIVSLSVQDFASLTALQEQATLVLYQQGPAGPSVTVNGRSPVDGIITLSAQDLGAYTQAQVNALIDPLLSNDPALLALIFG